MLCVSCLRQAARFASIAKTQVDAEGGDANSKFRLSLLLLDHMLQALTVLQGERIMHRDIKLANVFIDHRDVDALLADFETSNRTLNFSQVQCVALCFVLEMLV